MNHGSSGMGGLVLFLYGLDRAQCVELGEFDSVHGSSCVD